MSSSRISSPEGPVRLTPRQREAAERRVNISRRRQARSLQIRKHKKNIYLQRKRSVPCGSSITNIYSESKASVTKAEFKKLFLSYCQSPTSSEQLLSTIQNSIARRVNIRSRHEDFTIAYNKSVDNADNPLLLLEQDDENLAVQFLDCLRSHAASLTSDTCNEVSFQSILRILVHLTSISPDNKSSSGYYGRLPLTWSNLLSSSSLWLHILVESLSKGIEVELTSLVLGNLLGDDSAAQQVFRTVSLNFKESMVASLVRSVSPATPTAAWTLTNMIRNDTVSYAGFYCSESLLSTPRLMMWLREPSIATQTSWMIASLTAREEQTARYLCQEQQPSFLSALLLSVQNPVQQDQTVPLVQALGNLACHAALVTPLLTRTPYLIPFLQKVLTTTSSRDPLLVQAAWLAGCLLVDAGTEHHPSTTVAAKALIPILIDRIGGGGGDNIVTRMIMTLEEEREFASALWCSLQPCGISSSARLPFALNVPRSMLQTLVRLVGSNDVDAVLAGVNVIDLLFRRENDDETSTASYQNLQIILQEEELPDMLEQVCDSGMEEAANVAANILDDHFYNDFNDHKGEEENIDWMGGSSMFSFGMEAESRTVNGAGRGRGRGTTMPAWMMK